MKPLVSVILPCFNAQKYLPQALRSLLQQHYRELDIICIDDGSTDNTFSQLQQAAVDDRRVRVFRNEKNLGLIATLNRGLSLVQGEFFARMDADDLCPPERIGTLIGELLNNSQADLISCGYRYFRNEKKLMEKVPPLATTPSALKFISLFSTALTHAAMLGRSKLITEGRFKYDSRYAHAEDFELFSRLAWQNIPLTNCNEYLYFVRLGDDSVSSRHLEEQTRTNEVILQRNLLWLDASLNLPENVLRVVCNRMNRSVTHAEVKAGIGALKKAKTLYLNKNKISDDEKSEIERYLQKQILNIISQSNLKKRSPVFFFSTLPLLDVKLIWPAAKRFVQVIRYRFLNT